MKIILIIIASLLGLTVLLVSIFHASNKKKEEVIHIVNWLPEPRRAMTIPPFGIFIRKGYETEDWLDDHELVHWRQYQELGLWGFYIKYYKGLITSGYYNSPMEKEAREEGGWEDSDRTHKYDDLGK